MAPEIPLILRLKKRREKEIAQAQDIIVEQLYNFFPDAVIHGGTALWRCYQGNRFSEDVDVYIRRDEAKIREFLKSLETRGFRIVKIRIKENSVYSELDFKSITTKFEATFQKKIPFLRKYENSGGSFINVYTLTPEDLIIEKIETYLKRRKIRDLYDINFLLSKIENKELVQNHLKKLIENYQEPKDEKNLANIIIIGAVPSSEQLLIEITRWKK